MPARLPITSSPHFPEISVCPFLDAQQRSCHAAFSGAGLERRRKETLCLSDEHDRCPLFLSKLLRTNRPHFGFAASPMRDK